MLKHTSGIYVYVTHERSLHCCWICLCSHIVWKTAMFVNSQLFAFAASCFKKMQSFFQNIKEIVCFIHLLTNL